MDDELTHSDFRLASCQATAFTPEEEVSGPKLIGKLLPRWAERFDGEPFILPATPGFQLPREVPRVVLQSKSGAWRCEIASERVNVVWRQTNTEGESASVRDLLVEAGTLLKEYVRFQRARVGRVAVVVGRWAEHPTPAQFLARHFCQERWIASALNRPGAFELHAHKVFQLDDWLLVNSWVRNRTGHLTQADGIQRPGVFVEQDVNTLAEVASQRNLRPLELQRFFAVVAEQLGEILTLYYPEGARP